MVQLEKHIKVMLSLGFILILINAFPVLSQGEISFNVSTLINDDEGDIIDFYPIDNPLEENVDFLISRFSSSYYRGGLYYLKSDGNGYDEYFISSTNGCSYVIESVGDIDNDSDKDFLYSVRGGFGNDYFVLTNDGNGQFSEIPLNIDDVIRTSFSDIDSDNDLDVIYFTYRDLRYVENIDGFQTINEQSFLDLSEENVNGYNVFAVDVDNDEDHDILGCDVLNSSLVFYENSDGFSATPTIVSDPLINGYVIYIDRVSVCDFDKDDDLDLVLEIGGYDRETYETMSQLIWMENSNETFIKHTFLCTDDEDFLTEFLLVADFDSDGDNDIVTSMPTISYTLYHYFENINYVDYDIINGPSDSYCAKQGKLIDFDHDGDQDFLFVHDFYNPCLKFAENTSISGIVEHENPYSFKIAKAYPNPFNPSLNIQVSLPERGQLKLSVHNVLGQEVAVIGDRSLGLGYHNFTFDGSHLSSGIYFVKAVVEGKMNDVQKVVLMK